MSSIKSELHQVEEEMEHVILEDEYEHESVPLKARKSVLSISSVWMGFPMILTGAITGSAIVAGVGFIKGMLAILLGNLIMFAYVGTLGILSTKKGYNFALQASATFGRKGYVIASGLLSTLIIGWFAVQTGLTGTFMHAAFGANLFLMTLIAGLLYMGITFIGIKALSYIGLVSAPLFVILGIWAVSDVVSQSGWSAITSFSGSSVTPLSFGIAVTMVIALFADAGTMTGDFNRWAKNSRDSIIATFSAFPFANMVALIFGGIITASVANTDLFRFFADKGGFFAVLAVLFLFINLGSVCSHCLYNGAVGWSHIVGGRMRVLTIILGTAGIIAAVLGIWSFFINWLTLLGILVPPIGGIIIIDQFFLRKDADITENIRIKPFIAWFIGSAAALIVEFKAPYLSTAVAGLIVASLAYWFIAAKEKADFRESSVVSQKL